MIPALEAPGARFFFKGNVLHLVSAPYLAENTKEVVRPLGSWSERGVHTDEGVVAEGGFVNVVEGAHFLISRVFPKPNGRKVDVSKRDAGAVMEPAALLLAEPRQHLIRF